MMQVVDKVKTGQRVNKQYALNQESYWIHRMAKKNPDLENKIRAWYWFNTKPCKPFIKVLGHNSKTFNGALARKYKNL